MPTTTNIDFDHSVRSIQGRTDSDGDPVDDLTAEGDRLINVILSGGLVRPADGWQAAASGNDMTITVGSGQAREDIYAVAGDSAGQGTYLVRLNQTSLQVVVPPADASQQRIDEIWLVVADIAYDAGNRSLPRIGYRQGDPGSGPPGADSAWAAAQLLHRITVPSGATEIAQGDIADLRAPAQLRVRDVRVDAATGDEGLTIARVDHPDVFLGVSAPSAGPHQGGLYLRVGGSIISRFLQNRVELTRDTNVSGDLDVSGAAGVSGDLEVSGQVQAGGEVAGSFFRSVGGGEQARFARGAAGGGAFIEYEGATIARFRDTDVQLLRKLLIDGGLGDHILLTRSGAPDVELTVTTAGGGGFRVRLDGDIALDVRQDAVRAHGADVARVDSGTYTGNGSANRLISLPFTPGSVIVTTHQQSITAYSGARLGSAAVGVSSGVGFSEGTASRLRRPELDSSGFRVGDSGNPDSMNSASLTYTYVAYSR